MRTSDTTLADITNRDGGNDLVNQLLQYDKTYTKAKEGVSSDNPFLTYYSGSPANVQFPSLQDARSDTNSLYIVAPDNPMESFSLIQRKTLPNTLSDLSKDALRRVLGTLLDNA